MVYLLQGNATTYERAQRVIKQGQSNSIEFDYRIKKMIGHLNLITVCDYQDDVLKVQRLMDEYNEHFQKTNLDDQERLIRIISCLESTIYVYC